MKTFRMFTEDYMDSYNNVTGLVQGLGINSYVPHDDLNLRIGTKKFKGGQREYEN